LPASVRRASVSARIWSVVAEGMKGILGALVAQGYGVKRGVRNGLTVTLLASGIAAAEPATVVALGDSLTAGYGLADPATGLVPQLEGWLKARGHDVVIQNAGVSGIPRPGALRAWLGRWGLRRMR